MDLDLHDGAVVGVRVENNPLSVSIDVRSGHDIIRITYLDVTAVAIVADPSNAVFDGLRTGALGDWYCDELSLGEGATVRHEILTDSGAELSCTFERVSVERIAARPPAQGAP